MLTKKVSGLWKSIDGCVTEMASIMIISMWITSFWEILI